mgnify:CR=1 FL=1
MTATTHTLLRAEGFSCPSCVRKIEKALDALPGVTGAQVHFETQRIEVDHQCGAHRAVFAQHRLQAPEIGVVRPATVARTQQAHASSTRRRWSLSMRPCGSSRSRTRWKSSQCGYSGASSRAVSVCNLPQCGRPP